MHAWEAEIETTHYGLINVWVHEVAEGYVATPVEPLPVSRDEQEPIAQSRDDAVGQLARAIERAGPPPKD